MNIKAKTMIAAAVLALVPLVTSVSILSSMSTSTAADSLETSVTNQLIAIRDSKKTQIEDYFAFIRSQVQTFSNNHMVVDAMKEFSMAFNEVEIGEFPEEAKQQIKTELAGYYRDNFLPVYKQNNSGKEIDTDKLVNKLSDRAAFLQEQYIRKNPNPVGEKEKLNDADDGSSYSDVHKKYHPPIRDYLQKFQYYDIFLVDAKTGNVVYSVFKELDFATSLNEGAYADSGLAKVFKLANASQTNESVSLVDFEPYTPSYESPASFIASPIFSGNEKVGVLIFQMPIDAINRVMTSDHKWKEVGLGDSGETYLIGNDMKARSVSRFLIEDEAGFIAALEQGGVSNKVINDIKFKGTNIGIQTIDTEAARGALNGEKGTKIIADYRDVLVLSAYTPLNIPGLKWGLLSEMDEAEAMADVSALKNQIFITTIILFVSISAVAIGLAAFLASKLSRPIIDFSNVISDVEKNNDLTFRSDIKSKDELGVMSTAFNQMMEKIEALVQQIISSASQLAAAAEEVSSISQEGAANVERQRHETEQVATAMNEMSATVQEVANNTSSAAEAASEADAAAQNGQNVVSQTRTTITELANEVEDTAKVIQDLNHESDRIGTVLDVIKGIAEQTNLLALNAAIEAARAGEQGRGFAVVADEVRTLAQRTQESTLEIEEMIDKLQGGASSAVEVMERGREKAQSSTEEAEKASAALDSISAAVSHLNSLNLQIASAAEEQSATTDEMNRNIININDVAEQTAEGTRQTTIAADELARLASELQGLVRQFKINT